MGIKERREREKQITREAILNAARKIARTEGWPALTIRKVGEQIEYSPPMVYEYFASKEEILLHLMQEGFQQLNTAMQQASLSTEDREARLYEIAEAYWQFAMNNPELYQLMHGTSGVSLDKEVIAKAVQGVCTTTQKAIEEWATTNQIEIIDSYGATEIAWSLLHGLVSLHLIERVKGEEARAKALLQHALQSQIFAWKTTKKGF